MQQRALYNREHSPCLHVGSCVLFVVHSVCERNRHEKVCVSGAHNINTAGVFTHTLPCIHLVNACAPALVLVRCFQLPLLNNVMVNGT